ncbi:glycosyltransferase family 4 protein [Leptothrix ochracea]|uniref:glycosyltransferase family 4 protein n=1 Tax=Leptothrix ochracea TaxID=735331 RepID=UPI0034E2D368
MNRPPLRRIGLSFGQLRTFHDGLGEVSQQLGQRLAERAPQLLEEHGLELCFHLPERLHGHFGPQVRYLGTSHWQRWLHLRGERFDLWHSLHQFNPFRAPSSAKAVLQGVMDLNFLYFRSGDKIQKYLRRIDTQVKRSDAVVTISHFVKGDIETHLATQRPVHVIHLASRDFSQQPQTTLPGSPGLEPGSFFFHISRMAPSKNLVTLIDMMALWPEKTLVLAGGDSADGRALQAQVQARGLHNVQFHFDVNEGQKAWLYAHCAAFMFPSLTEGFGLPALEAMYFGRPVFLSNLTSLPEIGGEEAFYWHDFEPASMKRCVEQGLAHFDAQAGARVRARALSFSWDRCTDEYLALYQQLMQHAQV